MKKDAKKVTYKNAKHRRQQEAIRRKAWQKKIWASVGVAAGIIAIIAITAGLLVHFNNRPPRPVNISPDQVVARINGIDVLAMDVTLQSIWAQNMLSQELGEWGIEHDRILADGQTFGRIVREEAARIAATSIFQEDYARQLGITLTDEDIATIDAQMDDLELQFGEELHNTLRGEGFQDIDHVRRAFEIQQIVENMLQTIVGDPAKFAVFEQYMEEEEFDVELLGAKHILSSFREFDTEEEANEYAVAMLERALAGEDFDMLMREYGQDGGVERFPNGYSFTTGDMVPEFEQATRDLEMGEISGLVRTEHGYHIIKRTEPNMDDWHILRNMTHLTTEQRMRIAVLTGLDAMVEAAGITFLRHLDNVPIGLQDHES